MTVPPLKPPPAGYLPLATKEHPAPLDAFETAKPDEPLFTLQGGDPLAPPLVRLWAWLARIRAGVIDPDIPSEQASALDAIFAARDHSVTGDDNEVKNLKVRATAAEQVSWAMDEYAKGHHKADVPSEAADTHLDELQRIDLFDVKVQVASKLSSFRSELYEFIGALRAKGYQDEELLMDMRRTMTSLLLIQDRIEPRRLFKKKD